MDALLLGLYNISLNAELLQQILNLYLQYLSFLINILVQELEIVTYGRQELVPGEFPAQKPVMQSFDFFLWSAPE